MHICLEFFLFLTVWILSTICLPCKLILITILKISLPLGSTSRDILIASEVARSWLAGETAKIIQLGCKIKRFRGSVNIHLNYFSVSQTHTSHNTSIQNNLLYIPRLQPYIISIYVQTCVRGGKKIKIFHSSRRFWPCPLIGIL